MSTAECLSYFSDYGPTFVEWIDDSSCNVLFEDDYTAKRALIGRGKPLPPDNAAPDTAGISPFLLACCSTLVTAKVLLCAANRYHASNVDVPHDKEDCIAICWFMMCSSPVCCAK